MVRTLYIATLPLRNENCSSARINGGYSFEGVATHLGDMIRKDPGIDDDGEQKKKTCFEETTFQLEQQA